MIFFLSHTALSVTDIGAFGTGSNYRHQTASSRGYTLIDVLDSENLRIAWRRVKGNRGAAGIDGMEIGEFPAFMRDHWECLRGKLEDGTYSPSAVRRTVICLPLSGSAIGFAFLLLAVKRRRRHSPSRHTDCAGSPDPAGYRAGAYAPLRPDLQ